MNQSQAQQKPAITTIRGFQTPAVSGDEDSDYGCSTPARYNPKIGDVVSANCSPSLKPYNSILLTWRMNPEQIPWCAAALNRNHKAVQQRRPMT
ncbi:hypothetical protein BPAE_0172g00030 [Botrytis paeoniae]|uniref:Uncharacterized protein n=1 Tax=Botrytis paeoniae TaxID=278948 RepID=A0A4Z1FLD6_9HELO|nr:hypothetical protein BPAE_0172g00030 [Botrytis paeoniae]